MRRLVDTFAFEQVRDGGTRALDGVALQRVEEVGVRMPGLRPGHVEHRDRRERLPDVSAGDRAQRRLDPGLLALGRPPSRVGRRPLVGGALGLELGAEPLGAHAARLGPSPGPLAPRLTLQQPPERLPLENLISHLVAVGIRALADARLAVS